MIVVLGSIEVQDAHWEQALALSQAHVARSRAEPGCLAHAVHRDVENPLRLVFVEQWADQAALFAHFQLASSRAFAKAIAALCTQPPSMSIYQAQALPLPGQRAGA